jgi:hypothetical protein
MDPNDLPVSDASKMNFGSGGNQKAMACATSGSAARGSAP